MTRFKPKKPLPTPAYLEPLIRKICQASTPGELTACLENFHVPHNFERPEERILATWYEVLNKFDDLLDIYVKNHDLLPSVPIDGPAQDLDEVSTAVDSQASSRTISASGTVPIRLSDGRTSSGLIPRIESLLRQRPTEGQGVNSASTPRTEEPSTSGSFVGPVSSALVLLVLKATYRLLKNASYETKNVYGSIDQICALLGDSNTMIVLHSLEILNTLVQRSPKHRSSRAPVPMGVADRLRDLAQGWGGREKGLGLVDCCRPLNVDSLPEGGHSFRIEFKNNKSRLLDGESNISAETVGSSAKSSTNTSSNSLDDLYATRTVVGDIICVHVPDVRKLPGDEKWIVTDFLSRYKIPRSKAFTLLSAYRRAKAFGKGLMERRVVTSQQILALTTLSQLQPPPRALTELLQKEQELIPDIIALAKADAVDGLQDVQKSLRILAVCCLTAMSSERSRLNQITAAAGIGSHHGTFSSLLRSEISAMSSPTPERDTAVSDELLVLASMESDVEEGEKMETDSVVSLPSSSAMYLDAEDVLVRGNRAKYAVAQTVHMAEALLGLVHSVSMTGGSSGAANLVSSGTLGIIVPLLRNRNPSHARAVFQGIRAMQGIIEFTHASSGSQAFRDHDGLVLVADRIAAETLDGSKFEGPESEKKDALEKEDERLECLALQSRGESRQLYKDLLVHPLTIEKALAYQAPSSSAASRGSLPHSKWAILKSLHQLFLDALGNGGSQVRDLVANSELPSALRQILARPFHYGGGLFSLAATVSTAIAHAEPTATGELVKAGIAAAVLKSISAGLPPYGEAIRRIPHALAAICLAPDARTEIVNAKPLGPYVLRLASPFYSRALMGETPANIGGALDELMRHVEALRPSGNDAIIQFLTQAATFVQLDISRLRDPVPSSESGGGASTNPTSPTRRTGGNTGSSEKSKGEKPGQASTESFPSDYVLLERMKLAVAHNAARLAGFAQGSSEHQNAIVRKGGLEQMLQLRIAPAMSSSKAYTRDSHPSSRSSPTPANAIASLASSLKSFSSRHDAHVLMGLFDVIREDAAKVLSIAARLGNAWLPEEEKSQQLKLNLKPPVGNSKRETGPKEAPGRKKTRLQSAKTVASDGNTDMKVDSGLSAKDPKRKVVLCAKEINKARSDLRNALCVLRVDVVLLGNLSKAGPGSLAGAWDSAGGSAITALIAAVERSARWHLAVVYTGLKCNTVTESDLCTAQVTAAATPSLKSVAANKYLDLVPTVASRLGMDSVDSSEFIAASKSFHSLPEKEECPRQEVKGLPWAMETFVYASQKLYMSLGRGIIFSSRRINRDPARYAASARSLASTIGTVFALHLKAAEPLWSKHVMTMGEGRVCAAWDYVRRVVVEIQSTIFCESNRNTQGLILRFFLSAGGAEALQKACRPLSLLEGARLQLEPESGIDIHAYSQNKKRFDSFVKSNHLSMVYTTLILGEVKRNRQLQSLSKRPSGNTNATFVHADTDAVMTAVDSQDEDAVRPVSESNGSSSREGTAEIVASLSGASVPATGYADVNFSSLQGQVNSVSGTVLHVRKQAAINRIAADAWGAVSNLLHLFSNCPGLLTSSPSSLPSDPDNAGSDWEAKDVQRTAQSVAIKLLLDVTCEPKKLLSAPHPDEALTSDVVTIVLSILKSSAELSNAPEEQEIAENRNDSEDMDRAVTDEPPTPASPNAEHVQILTEMGFSEAHAIEALRQTYPPGGLEYATEWILRHPEPDPASAGNDSDDSSDDGEQNESGGEDQPSAPGEESGDIEMNTREAEENDSQSRAEGMSREDDSDQNTSITPNEVDEAGSSRQEGNVSKSETNKGKGSSDTSQSKSMADSEISLDVDVDSAALLRRSTCLEMNELRTTITNIKTLLKPDRDVVMKMLNSVVGFESIESETESKKKGETQRFLSKAKSVSVDRYTSSKKSLFESLIPVAKAAIKHEVEHGSASHTSFVTVEILSILQKDKCLSSDVRLEFAKVITSELEKFLNAPTSSPQGIDSVVGIRTSFVWAHYGGYRARQALEASGAANLAFCTLMELSRSWDDLRNTATVDEDATGPIQHLSINEDVPTSGIIFPHLPNSGGETKGKQSHENGMLEPRGGQVQAMNCMSTCLLILDAFVRYHARDSIVSHVTKPETKKDANAMDVDEDGAKETSHSRTQGSSTNTPGTPPATMDEIMRVFLSGNGDASKMDIEEKTDDLEQETQKLKSQAAENRKKALKSAINELTNLTGSSDRQKNLSFPLSELLCCCLKLLSSLGKYEVGDCMVALIQMICSLTADRNLAMQFMEEGGVEALLALPHIETQKTLASRTKMLRSLVRTVLRHIVEDATTLTEAMEADLRVLLNSGQGRSRQTMNMQSLVSSANGMITRDLECFTRALASCVRTRGSPSGSEQPLQAALEQDTRTMEEWMVESRERANVVCVINSLTQLLVRKSNRAADEVSMNKDAKPADPLVEASKNGLTVFALSQLSELVELCPAVAAQFLQAESPSGDVKGSALDFVVQELLPQPEREVGLDGTVVTPPSTALWVQQEETSEAARALVLSLMSKTANAHKSTVVALARAAAIESERDEARGGALKSLSLCIIPNTKVRVLREMVDSGLANNLAKGLRKLEMSRDRSVDVMSSVLKALSLIGQAAIQLSRQGPSANDDDTVITQSRDVWATLREDGRSPLASGFMVL